jgi:hypothetical protein
LRISTANSSCKNCKLKKRVKVAIAKKKVMTPNQMMLFLRLSVFPADSSVDVLVISSRTYPTFRGSKLAIIAKPMFNARLEKK